MLFCTQRATKLQKSCRLFKHTCAIVIVLGGEHSTKRILFIFRRPGLLRHSSLSKRLFETTLYEFIVLFELLPGIKVYKRVKLSLYRPGRALTAPGG